MDNFHDYFLTDRKNRDLRNYYWFQQGLNEEDIERVDQEVEEHRYLLDDGVVYTSNAALDLDKITRKSKICWLEPSKHGWLFERIIKCVERANDSMWDFELVGMTEKIQYSHYPPDGGHYDWHIDMGTGFVSRRKISVVVQLSDPDDYEGGDLLFRTSPEDMVAPRKKGAIIIFPSYVLHKVTPLTKGLRKSLVAWVSGPPYK